MTDRDREMARVLSKGTDIIELTDPKDRPTEAVAQLRDIAEWLRGGGFLNLAADADELAEDIDIVFHGRGG